MPVSGRKFRKYRNLPENMQNWNSSLSMEERKKLKAENSVFHQMRRVLAWENREKNAAYIRENGLGQFVRYLGSHQQEGAVLDYEEWLKDHAAGRKELKRQRNAVFSYMPLISIVIPLYNTPQEYLKEIVDSVIAQTYGNLSLIHI